MKGESFPSEHASLCTHPPSSPHFRLGEWYWKELSREDGFTCSLEICSPSWFVAGYFEWVGQRRRTSIRTSMKIITWQVSFLTCCFDVSSLDWSGKGERWGQGPSRQFASPVHSNYFNTSSFGLYTTTFSSSTFERVLILRSLTLRWQESRKPDSLSSEAKWFRWQDIFQREMSGILTFHFVDYN